MHGNRAIRETMISKRFLSMNMKGRKNGASVGGAEIMKQNCASETGASITRRAENCSQSPG